MGGPAAASDTGEPLQVFDGHHHAMGDAAVCSASLPGGHYAPEVRGKEVASEAHAEPPVGHATSTGYGSSGLGSAIIEHTLFQQHAEILAYVSRCSALRP